MVQGGSKLMYLDIPEALAASVRLVVKMCRPCFKGCGAWVGRLYARGVRVAGVGKIMYLGQGGSACVRQGL